MKGFSTTGKCSLEQIEIPNSTSPGWIISIRNHGEIFVYLYQKQFSKELLSALADQIEDPELSFDLSDLEKVVSCFNRAYIDASKNES